MDKGYIDQLETDKLLKLLEESNDISTNHPFLGFLYILNIGPGKHKVHFYLLLSAYKSTSKTKKLTLRQIKNICPNIKFKDGYLLLNKSSTQIKKLIKPKKSPINVDLKRKFNFFYENTIGLNIEERSDYEFYIHWAKAKKLTNLIDKLTFKKLCKLYFKECVEKKDREQTKKRTVSRTKSGTKS